MIKIDTMALGAYQTNCYIVYAEGSSRCVIIDPGYDAAVIKTHLLAHRLTPEAILLTHGHFDHVGAVRELAMDFDCKVFLHPQDLSMPPMMTNGPLYYTDTYADAALSLAGLTVRILHTPGHTPGSVCLMVEDNLFSGDTLFAGSCGRTDLSGGDWATILRSLKSLASLPENYRVFPGHGGDSTLNAERKYNPYLRF